MKNKSFTIFVSACMLASNLNFPSLHAQTSTTNSTIINVTDFGADPSGGRDSTIAIQKAIAEAKKKAEAGKNVNIIINFPEGRYDFYPDKAEKRKLYVSNTTGPNEKFEKKSVGLLLEGFNDETDSITVEGNNSLFMYHGKMTTFATIDSKNVTFQNFDVDFQVPTVIDITAIKKEGNKVTYYIPECFNYEVRGNDVYWYSDKSPYTNTSYWSDKNSLKYTQLFETKTGITRRDGGNPFANVSSIKDLGNHQIEITYANTNIQEGYCFQMRQTDRDHPGTLFMHSKNVQLNNLDMHFIHGFGMVGQLSDTITLNDVDFVTDPSRGTTTAGYADFIQMSGCKGQIEIKNSTFSNPHDDPINIHGTFLKVIGISNDRKEIIVQYEHNETAGFPNFFEGNEIEFTTKGSMTPVKENNVIAKRTIVKVDGPDGKGGKGSLNDLRRIKLTLNQAIPSSVQADTHVVENITYTPSVKIHNNIFKETPTRGVLCTTRGKVEIYDNTFDRMGMAAIYISNDAQGWYESGRSEDVTIRNNTFIVDPRTSNAAAIFIDPTNPATSGTIHNNIRILDNTFFMGKNVKVLDAKCVNSLIFKDNKVYRNDANIDLNLSTNNTNINVGDTPQLNITKSTPTSYNQRLYKFKGCKDVTIENNLYDGGLNVGIDQENTPSNQIRINNDQAVYNQNKQLNALGSIQFEINHKNIVQIANDQKTVTGIGPGSATVKAYTVLGNRRFESNPITFNVAGTAQVYPSAVTITNKETTLTANTLQMNANVTCAVNGNKTLTWSVLDPVTGNVSDKATISAQGLLTAKKNGVVEVVCETANGLESRKLLAIQKDSYTKASNVQIEAEVADRWQVVGNGIQLTTAQGGTYNNQTPANVFKVPLSGNVQSVSIKMEGKTLEQWEDAGLYLGTNADNYVAIQRKHRGDHEELGIVNETNGSASEHLARLDAISTKTTLYFKIEKTGADKAKFYYSVDGQNWTLFHQEVSNSSLNSNALFVAFAAQDSSGARNSKYLFSELKVNDQAVALVEGSSYVLDATKVVVQNKNESRFNVVKKDTIEATSTPGGTFNEQQPANLFMVEISKDVKEVSLKIDGKTAVEWEDVGLYLGKDANNYVAIQRKHRESNVGEKIGIVNESNGANAAEQLIDVANIKAANSVYFKLTRTNNKVQASYSLDGITWHNIGNEVENTTFMPTENGKLYVAFGAMGSGNTKYTFSELKVDGISSSFTKSAIKDVASVSNVSASYDQNKNQAKVAYTLPQGSNAIVKWAICDQENGTYALIKNACGNTLTTIASMKGKYIKAIVTAVGTNDIAGTFVESNAMLVTGDGIEEVTTNVVNTYLKNASIDGLSMNFNKKECYYHFVEATRKTYHVNFVAENAKAKVELIWNDQAIANDSDISLKAGRNTLEVKVTAPNQVGVRTYRFTIFSTEADVARLNSLKIGNQNITLKPNVYNYTVKMANTSKVSVQADGTNPAMSFNNQAIKNNDKVQLVPGKNIVSVMVCSSTSAEPLRYVVTVIVPNAKDATLANVTFNEAVQVKESFDVNQFEYHAQANSNKIAMNVLTSDEGATYKVSLNNKDVDLTKLNALELQPGNNTIKVEVKSSDQSMKKIYTYHVNAISVVYLSDLTMMPGSRNGWAQFEMDKNHDQNTLALPSTDVFTLQELQPTEFRKGVWSHADSVMYYDLENKGYTNFETYVGVDFVQHNSPSSSIKIRVSVDGQVAHETDVLYGYSVKQFISVTLPETAKKLKLEAFKVDTDSCDHVTWGDAKFIKALPQPEKPQVEVDKTQLQAAINNAEQVKLDEYVDDETKVDFIEALQHANVINDKKDATQAEVNVAKDALIQAQNALHKKPAPQPEETKVDKTQLQAAINNAEQVKLDEYVDDETKVDFIEALQYANVINDKKDATQAEVNVAKDALIQAQNALHKKPAPQPQPDKPSLPLIPLEPSQPVEKPNTDKPAIPSKPEQKPEVKPENKPNTDGTNTGDITSMGMFTSMLAASGVALTGLFKRRNKK